MLEDEFHELFGTEEILEALGHQCGAPPESQPR